MAALQRSTSGAFKEHEAVGKWEGVAVPAEASRAMFESAKGVGSYKQRRYDIFDAAFDAGHVRKVKKPKLQSASPSPA